LKISAITSFSASTFSGDLSETALLTLFQTLSIDQESKGEQRNVQFLTPLPS